MTSKNGNQVNESLSQLIAIITSRKIFKVISFTVLGNENKDSNKECEGFPT